MRAGERERERGRQRTQPCPCADLARVHEGVKRAEKCRPAATEAASARRGVEEGRGTRGRARSVTGGSQNILCADIYAVKVLDMASVTRRGAQRFFGTSGGSSGQEITCSRSNYTGSYPRTVPYSTVHRYRRIRRSQSTLRALVTNVQL